VAPCSPRLPEKQPLIPCGQVTVDVNTDKYHCCTWLLTGIVGYLTMLRPTGARSPYIIMAVNCVWVAVAAFIALKAEFR
jgi:hypothetical protein